MKSQIDGLRRSQLSGRARHSGGSGLLWMRCLGSMVLGASIALAGGCSGPTAGGPGGGRAVGETTLSAPSNQQATDDYYLIAPLDARDLGYRIDWQRRTLTTENSGIKIITVQGDSVFVMDGRNFLSRLRKEDGQQLWRVPVADALDEIHGITFMPGIERVFVTSGGDVLVLDSDTGSQIAKQRLGQIANTEPAVFRQFFVFGARNGQVCWHSYEVGHQWRGYQVSQSIQLAPLLVDRTVIVVGSDGRIMVLDAGSASQIWSKRLLDIVTAPPAAGGGHVYVAGQDQHLWAFDLDTGRNTWRYLTEDPLSEGPVLLGDQVYQQIPSEGLVCFEAMPLDAPDGVVVWRAPQVRGSVIGRIGSNLLVWDRRQQRLEVVSVKQGAAALSLDLPAINFLLTGTQQGADLFAASNDGRVVRLVPRS